MIKKILLLTLLMSVSLCFAGGAAIDGKAPFFQKTYSLPYTKWDELKLSLYQIAIEYHLAYMDNSVPYPSGAHTLLVQMGQADKVAVIVVATKDSDIINLNINCDSQCEDWLTLKDKLIKLFK